MFDHKSGTQRLGGLLFLGLALMQTACSGDGATGPASGTISFAASTSGEAIDADGYQAIVHGVGTKAVAVNGTIAFGDVPAGEYETELADVADNCTVTGDNPRSLTVRVGETSEASFQVACAPITGSIAVTISTTGDGTDIDGFLLSIDGTSPVQIEADASLTFSNQSPGATTPSNWWAVCPHSAQWSVTAPKP
jgi:hypothetical protein